MADPLAELEALADPSRAAAMAVSHGVPRRYLGIAAPALQSLVDRWRTERDVAGRVALAAALWDANVHEARVAAAKLLTQARFPRDEPRVWAETRRWVPDFDGWALADHACKAIERRLVADPGRLDLVEGWTRDENPWVRRAALVATLPWTKLRHPGAAERAARERILGWAAALAPEREGSMQRAIGAWLQSLSLRDPERVRAFLDGPGAALTPLARREALRRIG